MLRPLFAYGILRDPDVLEMLLGRRPDAAATVPAIAADHRVVYFPGRTYPAIQRVPGRTAEGMLLTSLSGTDLALLDLFEGGEYSRRAIEIIVSGQPLTADAYLPVPHVPADAQDWCLADWTSRHKAELLAIIGGSIGELRRELPDLRC